MVNVNHVMLKPGPLAEERTALENTRTRNLYYIEFYVQDDITLALYLRSPTAATSMSRTNESDSLAMTPCMLSLTLPGRCQLQRESGRQDAGNVCPSTGLLDCSSGPYTVATLSAATAAGRLRWSHSISSYCVDDSDGWSDSPSGKAGRHSAPRTQPPRLAFWTSCPARNTGPWFSAPVAQQEHRSLVLQYTVVVGLRFPGPYVQNEPAGFNTAQHRTTTHCTSTLRRHHPARRTLTCLNFVPLS